MKIKRQKHVHRVLTYYKNFHQLEPPYKVLLDGTFCKAALSFKINIAEQLPKYLDCEVKIKTTRCVVRECKSFGKFFFLFLLHLLLRSDVNHLIICRAFVVWSMESAAAV